MALAVSSEAHYGLRENRLSKGGLKEFIESNNKFLNLKFQ